MTTTSFRKSILSAAAIAATAFITFTADAKPMTCSVRQSYCNERCIMNNTDSQASACIQRTCDRQYNNCMQESSGGGERGGGGGGRDNAGGGGGGGGKVVRDHRRPR